MKQRIKILPLILAVIMLIGLPASAIATEQPSLKEEVVYINLSSDGSVNAVYVVNIAYPGENGTVIDYGKYVNVRNMTTSDSIDIDDDRIQIQTTAEKVYYEGTLGSVEIPWVFEFKYFMDGQEYSAQEVAGKSGALEILFSIKKNENTSGVFFKNLTLQAAFTLNTLICRNIVAKDASFANVGEKKKLTYTVLPGEESQFSITADVENFEMDAVMINALPLSMSIDDEMLSGITELRDAIEALDDGANKLDDAIAEMESAVDSDLASAARKLKSGSGELVSSVEMLVNGLSSANTAASDVAAGTSDLSEGISQTYGGFKMLREGVDEIAAQARLLAEKTQQSYEALLELQKWLKEVDISEDVSDLPAAHEDIATLIDDLIAAVGVMEGAVGYEAYKNTVGVNALSAENSAAIKAVNAQSALLSGDEGNAQVIAALNQAATALEHNNTAIAQTQNYFEGLSADAANITANAFQVEEESDTIEDTIQRLIDELGGMPAVIELAIEAVDEIVPLYAEFNTQISTFAQGVDELAAGFAKMEDSIKALQDGALSLKNGTAELSAGLSDLLSGAKQLQSGINALDGGMRSMKNGIYDLQGGVTELQDGSSELADGTTELNSNTSDIDSQINEMVDAMSGNPEELVSFVSKKNTRIQSVQFVLKTDTVTTQLQAETESDQEEVLSVWQKFLRLFGLY